MIERGLYEEGRLLVIAPTLNTECQAAIARYRTELILEDPAETRFQAICLEDVTAVLGDAGADTIAERVTDRYLDFGPVHEALIETFQAALPAA